MDAGADPGGRSQQRSSPDQPPARTKASAPSPAPTAKEAEGGMTRRSTLPSKSRRPSTRGTARASPAPRATRGWTRPRAATAGTACTAGPATAGTSGPRGWATAWGRAPCRQTKDIYRVETSIYTSNNLSLSVENIFFCFDQYNFLII